MRIGDLDRSLGIPGGRNSRSFGFAKLHHPDLNGADDLPSGGPAKDGQPVDGVLPDLKPQSIKPTFTSLGDGPEILLDKPIVFVGRHADADVRMESKKISREHCVIVNFGNKVVIKDLGSTNHTYVNGEKVDVAILEPNCEVQIANLRYQFQGPQVESQKVSTPTVNAELTSLEGKPDINLGEFTLIGRKDFCTARIDDRSVSRAHLVIVQVGGQLVFRDLASTNDTKVNGQRVIRGTLFPNDKLSIGGVKYQVQILPSDGNAPALLFLQPEADLNAPARATVEADEQALNPQDLLRAGTMPTNTLGDQGDVNADDDQRIQDGPTAEAVGEGPGDNESNADAAADELAARYRDANAANADRLIGNLLKPVHEELRVAESAAQRPKQKHWFWNSWLVKLFTG